jgi:hypothetical protein
MSLSTFECFVQLVQIMLMVFIAYCGMRVKTYLEEDRNYDKQLILLQQNTIAGLVRGSRQKTANHLRDRRGL